MIPARLAAALTRAGIVVGLAALVGCAAPGPSTADLGEEPLAEGLPGFTLLGERRQDPSGGGVTGIESFGQLEQVWASDQPAEVVADALLAAFGDRYALTSQSRPDGGARLTGTAPSMAVTITISPEGAAVLAGEAPPPLRAPPPGTTTWVTSILAGQP